MVTIALGLAGAALYPVLGAEERGLTQKATRPPFSSPRINKPFPSPDTKPAPSASPAQNNNNPPKKPKWEYTTVEEGMNFIVDGKENAALRAKINLMGVNGWELVTVYAEGAQKVLIYKRPL